MEVVSGKLRLFVGMVKDHASIGKAIMSSSSSGCHFPDIEVAVLRATSHDNGSIDNKHLHQILFLVSSSPQGLATPFLAERISRRLAKTTNPLVALKSLLLVHRLLRGGNRCFEQELRGAYLSGHLQMSTLRNVATISNGPEVSFLHSYAAYLEERIGWRINDDGKLEPVVEGLHFWDYDGKSIDLVFRKLPKCQVYIDRVLDCLLPCNSLINNLLAQASFINILKESFQVYATYSECIGGLINLFFDLTKQARAMACEILKCASQQSRELHDLYEKCKKVTGESFGSSANNLNHHKSMKYPSVQIITMDHFMALESCSKTDATNSSLSSCTLFSSKLETTISKDWVLFEDE